MCTIKIALILMLIAFNPTIASAQNTSGNKRYLPLPDGSYIEVLPGETPEFAWARAIRKHPEAFGFEPNTGPTYNLDYFNDCRLKGVEKAKNDAAVGQIVQACMHKATPKKCRAMEKKVEQAECFASCGAASYFSKTIGDCSTG